MIQPDRMISPEQQENDPVDRALAAQAISVII